MYEGHVYVEGYAFSSRFPGIPVHHAWCTRVGERIVVDPTWDPVGVAYLGVEFETVDVRRARANEMSALVARNGW